MTDTKTTPPNRPQSYFDGLIDNFTGKPVGEVARDYRAQAKAVIDKLDALDGNKDGIIHRNALKRNIREQFERDIADGKIKPQDVKRAREFEVEMEASLDRTLPGAFRVNEGAVARTIKGVVTKADTNRNGLISKSEGAAAINDLGNVVKDVYDHLGDYLIPLHTPGKSASGAKGKQ